MLVADAVDGRATPLQWAVAAYLEIGRQTGRGPEAAFQEVAGEVHAGWVHARRRSLDAAVRRALVTGHRGFIGRHIHAALVGHGWEVHGIDLADGFDAVDFFRRPASADVGIDLVVHCAALVGGRKVIEGQQATLAARDLALDAALFEWAMRARPGRIVYFSSSAAYPLELQTRQWIDRLDRWGGMPRTGQLDGTASTSMTSTSPTPPMGGSKLTGERLAAWATHEADPRSTCSAPSPGTARPGPRLPVPRHIQRARTVRPRSTCGALATSAATSSTSTTSSAPCWPPSSSTCGAP